MRTLQNRRAVIGWMLILTSILIPVGIGFLNPDANRLSLLRAYDWLYGIAFLAFFLGLSLAVAD